ncbi:putative CD109 antigen [Hypsibius exemplaris]|uniref:CD109 antigen n=1 Tax=Hypsibius exemplaris TaxID=2072580 RepID=A0A1W0WS46_HYPEX|nr:putative CD109 antigen [Hypsibius exemplaris]
MTIPARTAAVRYLERVLDLLFDPYEVAIVTYALTVVVDSHLKDAAFDKLDQMKRSFDSYIYWGKEQIEPPGFILRNNLPYMEAHLPNNYESTNIAATSYALMVYNLRQSFLTEKIAAWLNTQRLKNFGFSSTQDTIMAAKALMHHSYYSNVREATDMNITIKPSSSPGLEAVLHVTQATLSNVKTFEIPNPWGQIQAIARGSGYALLQMDVEYTVDHWRYIVPPPVKAFDVYIDVIYTGKNNSILILKPCARWTLFDESPQSGMAVIEIDIPSGYIVHQPDLEEYCGQQTNHLLRYAEFYDGKVSFFLDYLDGGLTCVEVLATRWYPVANQTRWLTLKVFDFYAPERFNTTMYEATPLYAQNICHVCGSFQCPYCPSYNTATSRRSTLKLDTIIYLLFFVHLRWVFYYRKTTAVFDFA